MNKSRSQEMSFRPPGYDDRAEQLYILAQKYFHDQFGEMSQVLAVQHLRESADLGYPLAQYQLGIMLFLGIGLKPDQLAAADLFEDAAEAGIAEAQALLGMMYVSGKHGVFQNYEHAAALLKKAALAGVPSAQNNLALLYLTGKGVQANRTVGMQWLTLAARNGHETARTNIREMRQNGYTTIMREPVIEEPHLTPARPSHTRSTACGAPANPYR